MISSSAASSLIKATVSSLPCTGLCPSCGVSQARVYECGYLGTCDGCLDVLLGVAELPGRSASRRSVDDLLDDVTETNLHSETSTGYEVGEEITDDHDAQPDALATSPPSHASLQSIDLHTTDGFEICEHCGAATKHHCSAGHVICLGCMAAHSGCPLCIEAEGGDEDLSYLDC
jgi:hypothetical protein